MITPEHDGNTTRTQAKGGWRADVPFFEVLGGWGQKSTIFDGVAAKVGTEGSSSPQEVGPEGPISKEIKPDKEGGPGGPGRKEVNPDKEEDGEETNPNRNPKGPR